MEKENLEKQERQKLEARKQKELKELIVMFSMLSEEKKKMWTNFQYQQD
jgi:hypothetical protein